MVKGFLLTGLLSFSLGWSVVGFGIENPPNGVTRQLKVKAALSFSPGFLTEKTKTIQLHGYLGCRPNSGKIELRGDGFYLLDSFGDRPRFTMNHQLFAGAFYRFSDQRFQPYVGFQPGIAYSQSSEFGVLNNVTSEIEFKKTINPVGSVAGGIDFFSEKLFFMFVETRYIFGKHKADSYPVFLDEFRISFGLGFHF
jgi:hypothetical protein